MRYIDKSKYWWKSDLYSVFKEAHPIEFGRFGVSEFAQYADCTIEDAEEVISYQLNKMGNIVKAEGQDRLYLHKPPKDLHPIEASYNKYRFSE